MFANKTTKVDPMVESHENAKAIMGGNFLGLEEVQQAFGVKYTPAQRAKLATIPFSEETLCACKDSHVLVAGFPMSINDVRKNRNVVGNAAKLFYMGTGECWLTNFNFANKSVECRWYLLRKKYVDAVAMSYGCQIGMIPKDEENPEACDVVFATIALFLKTGERLFRHVYARCNDRVPTKHHVDQVYLGLFDLDGLRIYRYWDDYSEDTRLGICSIRVYRNRERELLEYVPLGFEF